MQRYRLPITLLLSTILFVMLTATVWGQTASGRLQGTVRDSTGPAVVGALIRATDAKTGVSFEALSREQGVFVFPALHAAEYELRIEAAGYRATVIAGVVLKAAEVRIENLVITAGDGADNRVAEAGWVRIQDSDTQIAGNATRRDIELLPVLPRDPLSLAAYQPGVAIAGGDMGSSSVNGVRPGSNGLRLDGVEVGDAVSPQWGRSLIALNSDSIEQFRVVTHSGTAQYGGNVGAQVDLVTRSGGNAWAGSIFEYFRNAKLNSNEFFNNATGIQRPKFNQNLFGTTLGGPIVRNRTFVFGNYQGRRTDQEIVRNRVVLTPEAKAGLFRWLRPGGADVQEFDILKNDPRQLGMDPAIAQILKQLPDPNNSDVGDELNTGGYRFNNPTDSHEDQFTLRLDHSWTGRHHMFYRHNWQRSEAVDWRSDADPRFPGQPAGTESGRLWGNALGLNSAISASLVNELRIGYRKAVVDLKRPARLASPMLLSNTWTDPLNPDFPSGNKSWIIEATDNLSFIMGRHILKMGFTFRHLNQSRYTFAGSYPNVSFARDNGNLPPSMVGPRGNAVISSADRQRFENLYNDLLGRMDQVTQTFHADLTSFQPAGVSRVRDYRSRELSGFIQDSWKWRSGMTLNFGMRYEFQGVPTERNSLQGALDKSGLITATANIGDFSIQRGGGLFNRTLTNFAPRFGFAWDPFGPGGIIMRGSYGLFYDRLAGSATDLVDDNTPGFSQTLSVYPNAAATDFRLKDGIPAPARPSAPVKMLPKTRSTSIVLFDPELRNGMVHHFSLTLQRELFGTLIEVGYVGTRGRKLFMNLDLNQNKITEDFLRSYLELQAFRLNLTPVPASNTLVRIFGSVNAAITAIGGTVLEQGLVGTAADTVDRIYYGRYAGAGVSDFYLRNFPQFDRFVFRTNDGRSYYDSLQIRAQRRSGPFRVHANYTWSKSLDNLPLESNGFEVPLDSFNLDLTKGPSDGSRPHVLSAAFVYSPLLSAEGWLADSPRWFRILLENWDLGMLVTWESGAPFSVSSGRRTTGSSLASYADYSGSRNVGELIRAVDGIYWFESGQIAAFSSPTTGKAGNSGRNSFRGPDFLAMDLALTKRIQMGEKRSLSLRGEVYNLFNRANFGLPSANLLNPAELGRISSTQGNPRTMQVALRFEF